LLEFGMPTLIENRSIAENIALCHRLGLRFIELNMNLPEYQAAILDGDEGLVRAAADAGIYYTVHLDENLNIADFNRLVSDAYFETVFRTIRAGEKLLSLRDRFGDSSKPLTLNMHMNHGVHFTLPDRKVQLFARHFDLYRKSFALFRERCERWIGNSEIKIVIENTDGFPDYEEKAIEYLLESPCFGLTWDIGHSKASGEKDVPFILEHRNALCHFHLHDGTERPARDHLALGDGEIDLRERLRLADQLQARCVLETKTVSGLEKSAAYLQRLGFPVCGNLQP